MKYIITTAVIVIVGLVMLTSIADATEVDYIEVTYTVQQEYTASNSSLEVEPLELSYDYVLINFVKVNGIAIDLELDILYGVSDNNTIVLENSVTDTGDAIVIEYTHIVLEVDDVYTSDTRAVVNLIPFILAIGLVGFMAVMYKPRP